jgi:hypothetical protein
VGFGQGNPAVEAAIAYVAKKNPAEAVKKSVASTAAAVAA